MIHFVGLASGIQLAVEQAGRGPVLLLVHGFPLDHRLWQPQWEALSDRYRVVVPDLRGFGGSSVTPGTVTMAQFADDLAELLDQLQITEPIALGGLSMGGYIAWQFWLRHRPRLGRLILCHTRAAADSEQVARGRQMIAAQVLAQGVQQLSDDMSGKLLSPATLATAPEKRDVCRGWMRAQSAEGVAAAQRGMAERPDMTQHLPQIALPTLVVAGASDVVAPEEEMRAMAAKIPQSRFEVIQQAGHLSPLEQPAELNDILRSFLNATAESRSATDS